MKGFIKVTQLAKYGVIETLVPIAKIKFIEQNGDYVEIVLDFNYSKNHVTRASLFVFESLEEIRRQLEAAI